MTDKVFIDTNILVYAFLDIDNTESHAKHVRAVKWLLLPIPRNCKISLMVALVRLL